MTVRVLKYLMKPIYFSVIGATMTQPNNQIERLLESIHYKFLTDTHARCQSC